MIDGVQAWYEVDDHAHAIIDGIFAFTWWAWLDGVHAFKFGQNIPNQLSFIFLSVKHLGPDITVKALYAMSMLLRNAFKE